MALSSFSAGQRVTGAALNAVVTAVNLLLIPPRCEVTRAAVQSLATGSATTIIFDTETADTDTMFAATPSDTVTIKTAGKYICVGGGSIVGNSGLKVWEILKNGSVQRNGATTGPDTALQTGRTQVVVEVTCAVNDEIKLQAFQNTGSSQNATATLTVRKVSD